VWRMPPPRQTRMFHDFTNLNKYTLGLRSDKHATNVLKRGNVSTGSVSSSI